MLLEFKVSNPSRLISDEIVFSAIATEDNSLLENIIEIPKYNIRVLKTMAIFGANGSGKTSILKAMNDAYEGMSTNFNSFSFTFYENETIYEYWFSRQKAEKFKEGLFEYIDSDTKKEIDMKNIDDFLFCDSLFFYSELPEMICESNLKLEILKELGISNDNSKSIKKISSFVSLFLWCFELEKSKTLVIDTLSYGLHPRVLIKLLQIFNNPKINKNNCQLIFTTHETQLMNKIFMRPDQLYLVDKTQDEKIILGRVSDFDTSKYTRLDYLYLNGAMGGVPSINIYL